jgi:hypothetical protein
MIQAVRGHLQAKRLWAKGGLFSKGRLVPKALMTCLVLLVGGGGCESPCPLGREQAWPPFHVPSSDGGPPPCEEECKRYYFELHTTTCTVRRLDGGILEYACVGTAACPG